MNRCIHTNHNIYEMIQCESIPICDNICEQHFIYLRTRSVDEHAHRDTYIYTRDSFALAISVYLHSAFNWIYKYYMDMFIGTPIFVDMNNLSDNWICSFAIWISHLSNWPQFGILSKRIAHDYEWATCAFLHEKCINTDPLIITN